MRALVFSASGAFGAYHAGACQALEEARFRPEILVGGSIGSITAAAVARGASARRVQDLWRDPASNVFRGNFLLGDWSRDLTALIEQVNREFPHSASAARLRVPITRIPSTRIEVRDNAEVTPQVLLASCSIPFLFRTVPLDGHWYVDGGIFHRLAVALAVQAGATDIITVDPLARPPSRVLRLGLHALTAIRSRLISGPDLSSPAPETPLAIEPARPLGAVIDLIRWDRARVDRHIDLGYRDALRAIAARPRQMAAPIAESAAPQ